MSSFRNTVEAIVAQAKFLADCKVRGSFEDFAEALFACGITESPEIRAKDWFYWERLLPQQRVMPLAEVTRSVDLCNALGIELSNHDVPKAGLVYELFAALADDFLDITVVPGQHKGGQDGRLQQSHRVMMRHSKTGGAVPHPLYEYFQGREPRDYIDQRIEQKSRPLQEAMGKKLGLEFGQLLSELQMNFPAKPLAQMLGEVVTRGLNGEEVILTGAFCPDYAYEETGNPSLPYRYTFDGLGTGVGLVAQQFARVVPPLSAFLQAHSIKHRIVLGIGDFEADSQETLERVGLPRSIFLDRCKESLKEFGKLMSDDLPLTLEMCDLDRSHGRLRTYQREAQQRMLQEEFGRMDRVYPEPQIVVRQIIKECRTFYERWYDRKMTDEEVLEKVLYQGGEYAALSRLDSEDFGENVIVISGDRPMMHAFDQFFTNVPVLSVKRAY